jgi:predicted NBD/HSP70 family sugar kinase
MRIVALDIGATMIKSGIIEDGTLFAKIETPSNANLGGPYLIETAKSIIAGYSGFDCIGISTAGQVDSEKGIIRYANQNIPEYTGMNIREIFQSAFNVPIVVENDVNAAALGEALFGIGQKEENSTFLCLTYGTGIGGAIVIDGKLYKGAVFSAGEFGHIITHAEKNGYYEKYASTKALVKNVQAVMPELDNGKKIFKNLDQPVVKEMVDNWIDEVLYGLISLIHIFNPSLVVLGGGIMKENYIIKTLQEKIYSDIMPCFNDVVLAPAALGNNAGLFGAGYLAGLYAAPH